MDLFCHSTSVLSSGLRSCLSSPAWRGVAWRTPRGGIQSDRGLGRSLHPTFSSGATRIAKSCSFSDSGKIGFEGSESDWHAPRAAGRPGIGLQGGTDPASQVRALELTSISTSIPPNSRPRQTGHNKQSAHQITIQATSHNHSPTVANIILDNPSLSRLPKLI